jgi:hypothetical protein
MRMSTKRYFQLEASTHIIGECIFPIAYPFQKMCCRYVESWGGHFRRLLIELVSVALGRFN